MEKRFNNIQKKFIVDILRYLKNTNTCEWCLDVVRSKDEKQNCLFGHVFNYGVNGFNYDGKKYYGEVGGQTAWELFECFVATTYTVYDVNDGKNSQYQQNTSKERCIKYIYNILTGVEKNTAESMEECYKSSLSKNLIS